jgi:type II secretory pathway component PulF
MAVFIYKAIDRDGRIKAGTIESETIGGAHEDLTVQGLNVLSVKEAGRFSFGSAVSVFSHSKVKRAIVIEFATNLAVIMRAGIPLLDALDDISQSLENKHLKFAVDDMRERIRMGIGFSEALSFHKKVFPDVFIRLVTVGEETGRLEQSLTDVSVHLQRMEDLSTMMKRALIYPIILVVLTFGMMGFWLIYVLPKVIGSLEELGVGLPLLTRALMALSDIAVKYWHIGLIAMALFIVFFRVVISRKSIRYHYDYLKLKLPLVKAFALNRILATFTEQLRILVVAGITIDRSFTIVASALGSEVFKKIILSARDEIVTGTRISDALKEHSLFPRLVIRMVSVGETSGNLDHQFEFLSTYYYKRLEDVSIKFGKLLEPFLIVVIAGMYVVILMAILFPIYEGISKVGR